MTTLADIAARLAEPFEVKDIELLPKGSYERDGKTICMGLPYADVRCYMDRLNALAPGEWSTPPPIALTVGNKLVTYVTVMVCGIAHTDVGEAEPGENQGTEAWAQAFKRAVSHFGCGRYLYSLEKQWVPYDPKRKRIDLDDAGIRQVVLKMYLKAGLSVEPRAQSNGQPDPRDELNRIYAKGKPKCYTDTKSFAQFCKGVLHLETTPDLRTLSNEQLRAIEVAIRQMVTQSPRD